MTTGHPRQERFGTTGRSQVVDDHDRALWEALIGQAEGGKGFRPLVLNRLYAALGGRRPQLAEDVGASVELLHTAFVIHDDVIDGDDQRRGKPNVSGVFADRATADGAGTEKARRYGDSAGILAGDLALAGAVRGVALCGAPRGVVVRLLDLLEEVLHRTAAGELTDVRVSLTGAASVAGALQVAELKTAAYSFQLPLQAAAILAEVDDEMVTVLGQVGRELGIAYQLRDDLQGVFATREQTGKDPLGDLREGKCTCLIALARSSQYWDELASYVGDPGLTARGAARARGLLVACGARHAVEAYVEEHRREALVAAATLPPVAAEALAGMVDLFVPAPSGEPGAPREGMADVPSFRTGAP